MKGVIFAGGIGTRMWPASRVKSPKQFRPMVKGKSTLELMYAQYLGGYIDKNKLYVATNDNYVDLVKNILTSLKNEYIFTEPAMRDLGPAVGYAMAILNQADPMEPVAIVWSDDLVKKPKVFHKVLNHADEYLRENPNQLVYIGQKPMFPDQNKGWIHQGGVIKFFNGISMYEFKDWHYRPPLELAKQYFQSGEHAVNTGYFVSTPRFIVNLYKKFAPEMYKNLEKLAQARGRKNHKKMMSELYPKLDKISFDDLIISNTKAEDAVVLITDLGWYGFGDWEAIKEALQKSSRDVVTDGKVVAKSSSDSLIYNYTDKLVTGVGLKGMLIIATEDVTLVAPKEMLPEVKNMLKGFKGTDLEIYT